MNKKLKSVITYLTINGVFAALAYYGLLVGIPWCANFLAFGIWGFTGIAILGFLAMILVTVLFERDDFELSKQQEFMDSQKGVFMFPIWVDVIYDMCMIAFLIYFGWIGYAVLYLIQSACNIGMKKLIKRLVVSITERIAERVERGDSRREAFNDRMESRSERTWTSEDDDDLRRMGVID